MGRLTLKRCLNCMDKRCIMRELVETVEKGAYLYGVGVEGK